VTNDNSSPSRLPLPEQNESSGAHLASKSGAVLGATYRLDELVGTGAMGDVYSAEHIRLGRKFAVKMLRSDRRAAAVRRFRREARAIARVNSEFVVGVVDCGETAEGCPYLVMDLLNGENVRSILRHSGPLPIPLAVQLAWQACLGVAAVHEAGLIHRDIKPENLFVTRSATGEDRCKILDFGIAKTDLLGSTADGSLVGTIKYMAPEQILDSASVGPTVDIYSLAAVLYECLCGSAPHTGETPQELMFKVVNDTPAPVSSKRKEVPPRLADAIDRALAKSAERRFQTAKEFAQALAPFRATAWSSSDFASSSTGQELTAQESPSNIAWREPRSAARPPRFAALGLGFVCGMIGLWVLRAAHDALRPQIALSTAPTLVSSTPAEPVKARVPAPTNAEFPLQPVLEAPSKSSRPPLAESHRIVASPRPAPTPRFPTTHFDPENPYARENN